MKKITLLLLLLSVFAGHAKNLQGGEEPGCLTPTNVDLTYLTPTEVTFTWTESGFATAWEILVVEMGTPGPTDTTEGWEVEFMPTYTVTGLVPCVAYSAYIRTNCGDASSAWIGPFYFTTGGVSLNGTINETFETMPLDFVPFCWSAILNGDTLSEFASVKTVDNNPYEGSKALQMLNHSSGTDSNIILVSPNLPNLTTGTHRLRFYARTGFNAGTLQLGTVNEATNEGQFTFFEAVDLNDNYTEYTIDYTAYAGEDTYVALRIASPQYSSIFIDNIVWEAAPLCADVSGIVINDTTTDSVTLSWTANGDETSWDIAYTDSSITDASNLVPVIPAPTSNEGAVVTGLTENTSYNLWVRSVCEDGINGYWVGPITFSTACAPIAAFEEDFETTEEEGLPLCWSAVLAGETLSETSYVNAFDGFAHSGTKSIRMNNTDSGTEAKIILVSPKVNSLATATHRLKFWASGNGGNTILDIGTLDNNSSDAVFTSKMPITLGEQYAYYIVDFSDYEGTDQYIAFRNASTSDYTSVYIDDVIWEAVPTCADVTDINFLDLTPTSATVSWTAGNSETSWQVAHAVNTVTNPDLAAIDDVENDTILSLEGLLVGTSYNVWVRSVCGDDNGNWMGPIVLNTACNPAASFNENFDSVNYPDFPVCWSKILAAASPESNVVVDIYSATTGPNGMLLYGAYSGAGADIILISPPVTTLASGDHQLKFMASGSLPIEIGTLDGNTNEAVFTVFETKTLSESGAQAFTVDFANYAGTDTYIGFRLKTNGENAYASIDDVSWTSTLSSGSFEKGQFTAYPNPVKDILSLGYTENITNVTVFNLLGQKVMESNANSTSVKMDLSALSSGSYIVKVASNDQVQSIKINKQ
ncbi:MAG: T9SS type A sorting domain-containing protein [Flavobacterium sp.]|nr:MAG: T9SS type A sorting domain-containing protein [Flavobacterium sp.]